MTDQEPRTWDGLLDEAIRYVREHDVVLATHETTIMSDNLKYVASIKKRVGDQLYEASGIGATQSEAIVRAYAKWREYWMRPDDH